MASVVEGSLHESACLRVVEGFEVLVPLLLIALASKYLRVGYGPCDNAINNVSAEEIAVRLRIA